MPHQGSPGNLIGSVLTVGVRYERRLTAGRLTQLPHFVDCNPSVVNQLMPIPRRPWRANAHGLSLAQEWLLFAQANKFEDSCPS